LLSTFTVTRTVDAIDPKTHAPLPGTLRWAVLQANSAPGSTIVFDPTDFATPTTIALSPGLGQLELGAPMKIDGPAATVTVNAQAQSRVFLLDRSVPATISRLSINSGSTTGNGGGIDAGPQSSLNLQNCTIRECAAARGGGLYTSGEATLTDCAFVGDSATQFGGAVLSAFSTNLTNCTLSGNVAPSAAGLYAYHGTATLLGCTISGNTAQSGSGFGGGGMVLNASSVSITACTISGNYSASTGGGIDVRSGAVQLADCIFSGNSAAGNGGGLNVSGGTVAINRCVFSSNVTRGAGGGLNVSGGSVVLTDSTFSGNRLGGTGKGLNVSGGQVMRNGAYLTPTRISRPRGPAKTRITARIPLERLPSSCRFSAESSAISNPPETSYFGAIRMSSPIFVVQISH
jgi:hypothetical protein